MSCDNRNMNSDNRRPMRSKEELMDLITKVSFVMDDTRLFLDTHPDCEEALEYFKKMHRIRHELIKEYTERFGQIVSYHIAEDNDWDWNRPPQPWNSSRKAGC